jgi:hypothetical protein
MIIGKYRGYIKILLLLVPAFEIFITSETAAQNYNYEAGAYPGNPKENFAPSIKYDYESYKNIALMRPVYGSGSYDFNLTPQLLTDGKIESELPGWIATSSSRETYARPDREKLLDRNISTRFFFTEKTFWTQIEMRGNYKLPQVNGFNFTGIVSADTSNKIIEPWTIKVFGSDDTVSWNEIALLSGPGLIGDTLTGYRRKIYPQNYRVFNESIKTEKYFSYKNYRAVFNSVNLLSWRIADFQPMHNNEYCGIGGPYNYWGSWKSFGAQNEWVYIDLGNSCRFNKIIIYWLKHSETGSIQISDDAKSWLTIASLSNHNSFKEEIVFDDNYEARYVRFNFDKAQQPEDGFIVSEIEIYGTGAPLAVPHPRENISEDNNLELSGGEWKVIRSSLVDHKPEEISKAGYNDDNWITATVPGTVLISYLNNGMIPDPNFGDNQFLISDSYFYSDFIYRDEFIIPKFYKGKKVFLNLDGINWKADVFINGNRIGKVEGAFRRGKFDVSDYLFPGIENAIAVYIFKNDSPGFVKEPTFRDHQANGGELGFDNPTFHASVGWDWMPSIRGRNIGIWNEIYFSVSGQVTIENPFVSSKLPLPDTTAADITIELALKNHSDKSVDGKLRGKFGDLKFEFPIELSAGEYKIIKLDSRIINSLHINNPELWWPNGYGNQNLYDVELNFILSDGLCSDTKVFKTGIRELTYSEPDRPLKVWINGKRFIPRGGNWGFSESDLRYRSREFNTAVRYHKEMNLNMIRNWVGQTGDDEFFEACDKYGILVWQDFWLANPGDGPNPKDHNLFLSNAEDFIKRVRNHPSIVLYCGRNEGAPPEDLDKSIRNLLSEISPAVRYISSSSHDVVSGHGPYHYENPEYYFKQKATTLLHSEVGLPSPVSFESLKMMMPDSSLWPIGRMWGIHDFSMESAQRGEVYINTLEKYFGKIDNPRTWLLYAQWMSYEGYRAILEAQGKNRMGVLFWMTHPAWPSLVFQTYDYYFEPTGAFFGSKKGSEPIHIQWNALTDSIEIVNHSYTNAKNLEAVIEIFNISGQLIFNKKVSVDSDTDCILRIHKVEMPGEYSGVYFIKLKLNKGALPLSENFYWAGSPKGNYQEISKLPKTKLEVNSKPVFKKGKWFVTAELINKTKIPALMVNIGLVGDKDNKRILPAIFSDNFISLMPGETKTINIEIDNADTRGNIPEVLIEGVNIY